ncbi:hypothetical protein, partial [Roseobacter litoralis]|uniref:hypothetical protein n=1 Tax=Roseobacter litoralis TaxID=42443 RepID=UPI0024940ABE
ADSQEVDINKSTVDFDYLPKLANPPFFMTFDPALSYRWEMDNRFTSLLVALGMRTGEALRRASQVFIKPGIYAGGNRPVDFSLQVGYNVLNSSSRRLVSAAVC